MDKHRVLLVCMQPLLSEGLRCIFRELEDVQLNCLEGADLPAIEAGLESFQPHIILLAGEQEDEAATHLISSMLKYCADIPVVWIELEKNILRIYTSRLLPASSTGLIEAIRENDFRQLKPAANRRKTQSKTQRR
jgi:hypothetical protein